MLAALVQRNSTSTEDSPCIPSPLLLAMMTPADRDLERRIAAVRLRLLHARTSFGRRMALAQLQLLEGRRSATALRAIAGDRTPAPR